MLNRLLKISRPLSAALMVAVIVMYANCIVCDAAAEKPGCCESEQRHSDEQTDDDSACRCACTFSGVFVEPSEVVPEPIVQERLLIEPVDHVTFELSFDLFRPPRLS